MDPHTPQPADFHPPFIGRELLRSLMGPDDYLIAVEAAFRAHAQGRTSQPMPLHIAVEEGGFHAKGALAVLDRAYVAVKVNSNFPGNPARGLPTIQGAALLYDANDGRLLAILDSMEITARRTAAASVLAARHLARTHASSIAICGCGEQGRAQLEAFVREFRIARARAWDADGAKAERFADEMRAALGVNVTAAASLRDATWDAEIVVTATSSPTAFLTRECVRPGAFIAAVGADNPHKGEITPELMADATVMADSLDQCVAMGDLHHAIDAGLMTRDSVRAELADIVAGRHPGRTNDTEITVFDSTGMAIQDVASCAVAYERYRARTHPCSR